MEKGETLILTWPYSGETKWFSVVSAHVINNNILVVIRI